MRAGPATIIGALFLAEVTVTFESTMVYAALPTLIRVFGDPIMAGWLVTSHLLLATATIPIAGRLGDIRGRKKIMLLLLAFAAVGSILSAITSNFMLVLVGRALQGLSAAVIPLSIGVLRESLPRDRVPFGVGMLTTAQGVGAASGLVLGGAIIDRFDWHWLFVASAVLLVISYIVVKLVVPAKEGTPTREPIDWIEGLLPAPAIAALLLAISWSKDMSFLDPRFLGALLLGIVLMVWWVRRSLGSREPFIDLRLLIDRNVALANGATIFLGMGTMQIVFIFSTYIQAPVWTMAGLGLTATMAGLAKLPSNVLSLVAGPYSGWLTQRYSLRVPMLAGGALASAGWLIALVLPSTVVQVVLILCVISFGTTLLQAAVPNIIVASVPNHRTGEAIGTISVVRGMAAAIGTQLIAVMLASNTIAAPDGGAAFPSAIGFRITIGWIAALTIAATLLSLFILNRREERPPA